MSARSGSRVAGTDFVYLNEGAYGTVFVDKVSGRILKICRQDGRPLDHCRDVFNSEIRALEIASANETLAPHVIGPIKRRSTYQVLASDGSDISEQFMPDAAFEAAFVEGVFSKIGSVNAPNRDALTLAFRAAGIMHTIDASVTQNADGNIDKIIDFGMRDIELEW